MALSAEEKLRLLLQGSAPATSAAVDAAAAPDAGNSGSGGSVDVGKSVAARRQCQ